MKRAAKITKKINTQEVSDKDELVYRVLKAKAKILDTIKPSTQYMPFLLMNKPEWNNDLDKDRIYKTYNYVQLFLDVVEALENLPGQIKNS